MTSHTEELGPTLSARLTYLLKRSLIDLEDLHRDHLEGTGVNVRELTVLQLLDSRRKPESQQEVAGHLRVDRTTMVGLIDSLEGKGLVERRADVEDRRRNVVVITVEGRRTLQRATSASDEAERRLLTALDSDEAHQLRALLERVASTPR